MAYCKAIGRILADIYRALTAESESTPAFVGFKTYEGGRFCFLILLGLFIGERNAKERGVSLVHFVPYVTILRCGSFCTQDAVEYPKFSTIFLK